MAISDPLLLDEYEAESPDIVDSNDLTVIQEFYKDANIFVTGATGFLGKILVEKLLRSCHVSTVYVLVRSKKGKTVATRTDEVFDDIIFDKLRKECPKFRHKVVGIAGDCSLTDLGISESDRQMLIQKVNIVFHVAATVRFDEKLKTSVAINVRATQAMLSLAHEMPNLKSFIHVSTAYANCIENVIEEKFYPAAMDYKTLISLTDTLSEKVLDNLTPMLLDRYPNTYAFTKQIAESVVQNMGHGLPIGVVRPSIVVSTAKEPVRAWINNFYGPTGLTAGAGLGLIRVIHCDTNANANIVPVDMCVNSIITAAWDVNAQFTNSKKPNEDFEIPIYNFESSNDCPITWNDFMGGALKHGLSIPSVKSIWYFSLFMEKSALLCSIYAFLLHTVPAFITDLGLMIIGKKPRMLKTYSKIHKFGKVLTYFSTQTWYFKSHNVQRVCRKMNERDSKIFFSDLKLLDWDAYLKAYIRGIRVFLVGDPMDTLPAALIKWNRLYWAHQFIKVVVVILIVKFLWFLISWF